MTCVYYEEEYGKHIAELGESGARNVLTYRITTKAQRARHTRVTISHMLWVIDKYG